MFWFKITSKNAVYNINLTRVTEMIMTEKNVEFSFSKEYFLLFGVKESDAPIIISDEEFENIKKSPCFKNELLDRT